jgi:hypothetical protein
MTSLDVLILIPVIPAIPVMATCLLPWERWIPKIVPARILGPYLLYCSFAAWYFNEGWWVVGSVALLGLAACVSAAFDLWKARNLRLAQGWPISTGSIIHIGELRDDDGVIEVTITYDYAVQNERYAGHESFKFTNDRESARFKIKYADGTIKVHYRPDKPELSKPDLQPSR